MHMRKMIRAMLTGFGVGRIYEAADGAAALEAVDTQMPDILISETKLPIIDGFELMQLIRQPSGSKSPQLPIIIITCQAERKNIVKIRDHGATEILTKPFSISGLLLRIQNVIHNPRPFIEAPNYFGPDRRRISDPAYSGPRRRQEDLELPVPEPTANLEQRV